jgi:hypothetical protein
MNPITSLTRLPIVAYEGRNWYFDARLCQIRDIERPHIHRELNAVELAFFNDPIQGVVRVIFKDEGHDAEGRTIGPAYAENKAGKILHNYGWVTWKTAQQAAEAFGVEFDEV